MALKPIKLDKETRKELSKKLDPKLIKERTAGKTKNPKTGRWEDNILSYISANTCIDLLNKAFGHNWSMRIVDRWMEPGVPFPFVEKDGKVPVPQPPTAWCIVELSVDFVDEDGKIHTVTKSAFGSQSITGNQSTQSTNGYKGAQSDALKKAATLFGIALELYRKDPAEQEYFEEVNEELFSPWTDELVEQYKEQFDYIHQILELNGYTVENLNYWVVQATDEQYTSLVSMDPSYMNNFIDVLKSDDYLIHPGDE